MAAAMQKCVASGKSAEQCNAVAIKSCLAKDMSKDECAKAAEATNEEGEPQPVNGGTVLSFWGCVLLCIRARCVPWREGGTSCTALYLPTMKILSLSVRNLCFSTKAPFLGVSAVWQLLPVILHEHMKAHQRPLKVREKGEQKRRRHCANGKCSISLPGRTEGRSEAPVFKILGSVCAFGRKPSKKTCCPHSGTVCSCSYPRCVNGELRSDYEMVNGALLPHHCNMPGF